MINIKQLLDNLKQLPEYAAQLQKTTQSEAEARRVEDLLRKKKLSQTVKTPQEQVSDLAQSLKPVPIPKPTEPLQMKSDPLSKQSVLDEPTIFDKMRNRQAFASQQIQQAGERFRNKPVSKQWAEIGNFAKDTAQDMARGVTKFVFSAGASPAEVYTQESAKPVDVNNFFKYIIGPEKLTTYSYDLAEAIESGVDPKTAAVSTGISILMDAYLTGRLATAGAKQLSKLFPEEQHLAAWGTLGTPTNMAEAKQAFNNLQRKYHPDRPGGNVAISKQINNAYEVLKKQGIPDSNLVKTKLGQLGNALLSTPEYSEITNAVRLQRPNLFPQLEGHSSVGKPQLNIGGTIQPVMPSKRARELQELAKKQGVPTNVATYDTIVKQTELNKAKQFIQKHTQPTVPTSTANAPEQPLIQEAKKYKSAEEFVKAQGKTLYHGGTDIKKVENMQSKWGAFYMSENPTYAKSYGGDKSVLNEMVLLPEAKLADLRKPNDELINEIEDIISPKKTGKTLRIQRPDGSFVEIPETKGGLSNPVHSSADIIKGIRDEKAYFAEMPEVKQALKQLGYDGMITQESKFGANYGVWNKNVIKTKSQLTDIWNKAQSSEDNSLIPYLEGKKDLPKNVMNNALVTELKNYIANTPNLSPEFLQAAANSPLLTKTSEIAQEMGLLSPTDEDTFVGRVKQIEKVKKQKAKVSLKPYSPEQSGITKEQAAQIDALTKVNQQLRSKLNPETNTWASIDDRFKYGASRVTTDKYIASITTPQGMRPAIDERLSQFKSAWQVNKNTAIIDLLRDAYTTTKDVSIAMKASIDNSHIGRQGLKVLFVNPEIWSKSALESFKNFANELKSDGKVWDAIQAEYFSDPLYLDGTYNLAGIVLDNFERFPSSIPSRIPFLGRAFKASETAYKGSSISMRTRLYKWYAKVASDKGIDMTAPKNISSLGTVVNSLVSQGKFNKEAQAALKTVLWSPGLLKSNLDILTFGAALNVEPFAHKIAAVNTFKVLGGMASVLATMYAINPDLVELDPRSSKFGKILIGPNHETGIDVTAGVAQLITVISRVATGKVKSSTSGKLTDMWGNEYGAPKPWDVAIDFFENKTTPMTMTMINLLNREMFGGKKVTPGRVGEALFMPITVENVKDIQDMSDYRKAEAVWATLLDAIGLNSFAPVKQIQYEEPIYKEISRLQDAGYDDAQTSFISGLIQENKKLSVEDNELIAKDITQQANTILGNLMSSSEYQAASDEDKAKGISKFLQEIKDIAHVKYSASRVLNNPQNMKEEIGKLVKEQVLNQTRLTQLGIMLQSMGK